MVNKKFFVGILALMLVFGTALSSCATYSSVGGTSDTHGLFSGAKAAADGAKELASYSVILGLVDIGYADYVAKVRQAGGNVSTVTRAYLGFFTKITAYSK